MGDNESAVEPPHAGKAGTAASCFSVAVKSSSASRIASLCSAVALLSAESAVGTCLQWQQDRLLRCKARTVLGTQHGLMLCAQACKSARSSYDILTCAALGKQWKPPGAPRPSGRLPGWIVALPGLWAQPAIHLAPEALALMRMTDRAYTRQYMIMPSSLSAKTWELHLLYRGWT